MNKTIILIASFVTAQTMPMSLLMSKTNPITTKLALLNKAFVKPITMQQRQYFSKSINYIDQCKARVNTDLKQEEERFKNLSLTRANPQKIDESFARFETLRKQAFALEKESAFLRIKNSEYNRTKPLNINDPEAKKALEERKALFKEINYHKSRINDKFKDCYHTTTIFSCPGIKIEKSVPFKLPEE